MIEVQQMCECGDVEPSDIQYWNILYLAHYNKINLLGRVIDGESPRKVSSRMSRAEDTGHEELDAAEVVK